MIFLTVGTQFPFDRLTRSVDEAVDGSGLGEDIFGQIGDGSYQPRNFQTVPFLKKSEYDRCMREATGIISHAGIGTIATALEYGKPLLVMPRLKKCGEVVNDHQLAIARKFEQMGYLLAAYNPRDLPAAMEKLKTFAPRRRETQADLVANRIAQFLREHRPKTYSQTSVKSL